MERPSLFEFAGDMPAFVRLAAAHHQRCLDDPELNHPFSHPGHPDHVERLARYWAEVLGGPAEYSSSCGGQSAMLAIHAGTNAQEDLGRCRRAGAPARAALVVGRPGGRRLSAYAVTRTAAWSRPAAAAARSSSTCGAGSGWAYRKPWP